MRIAVSGSIWSGCCDEQNCILLINFSFYFLLFTVQPTTKSLVIPPDREVQVCLAAPSHYMQKHQQQLLPDWQDTPVNQVIIFLQKSTISFIKSEPGTAGEKDRLRSNFIRLGVSLIFALKDLGHNSDLFDPRSGYPLIGRQGKLTLDDNAVVSALLNYPIKSYQNCSLIYHPIWKNKVYPSVIVTSAPQNLAADLLFKLIAIQQFE